MIPPGQARFLDLGKSFSFLLVSWYTLRIKRFSRTIRVAVVAILGRCDIPGSLGHRSRAYLRCCHVSFPRLLRSVDRANARTVSIANVPRLIGSTTLSCFLETCRTFFG